MNKKIFIYAGISLFIMGGIAATPPPQEKPQWKNLKLIPQKTNEELMDRIMIRYSRQLGISCRFCHSVTKPDVLPKRADFASDENPQKRIARDMMRMTDKLNKKYFDFKNDYGFESLRKSVITCYTCHRGLHIPNKMKLYR